MIWLYIGIGTQTRVEGLRKCGPNLMGTNSYLYALLQQLYTQLWEDKEKAGRVKESTCAKNVRASGKLHYTLILCTTKFYVGLMNLHVLWPW